MRMFRLACAVKLVYHISVHETHTPFYQSQSNAQVRVSDANLQLEANKPLLKTVPSS